MNTMKNAEQMFIDNIARKKLARDYRVRACRIGDNAIRLVSDFFLHGIRDDIINRSHDFYVSSDEHKWTINDLDYALSEMEKNSESL